MNSRIVACLAVSYGTNSFIQTVNFRLIVRFWQLRRLFSAMPRLSPTEIIMDARSVKLGFTVVMAMASTTLFATEPMLDGRCDEYEPGSVVPVAVDGLTAHLRQTADHVWLCLPLPEGSWGMVDGEIRTPKVPDGIAFHVSAQLGEWPAGEPEKRPDRPDHPEWWNHQGWTANAFRFNGVDLSEGKSRPIFRKDIAREFQFSKTRFGEGRWHIGLKVYGVQGHPKLELEFTPNVCTAPKRTSRVDGCSSD